MSLDFNKVQKNFLTVKLNDDKSTVLFVKNPSKRLLDEFIELQNIAVKENGELGFEHIGMLYELCGKILSRNKNGKLITKEFCEELFDIEDIMILFNAYMEFVTNQMSQKN